MNAYRSFDCSADPPTFVYSATLKEAHDAAKQVASRIDARVELVDVMTDKASIVGILNGESKLFELLRTWKLTPRGGLTECENGE